MKSLFDLVVPAERVNRRFLGLTSSPCFLAARRLMDEVFAEFTDVDHSFAKEFQTGGFSPRVFELALFAALREQHLALDRTHAGPDFLVTGTHPVVIEATTSNPKADAGADEGDPSSGPLLLVPDDTLASEQEFIFQAGKALRRKLLKRDAGGRAYWELPHTIGVPFTVALESFHAMDSLFHATGPLATYLFGRRDVASFDEAGTLTLTGQAISTHEFAGKSIPSGLFALPEARYLAAVLFSNSATVNKFGRMGTELGYGPDNVAMMRIGSVVDPDPNAVVPQPFGYLVGDYGAEDRESFCEGWHVFHNPHAETPLRREALPEFTHHELLPDGRVLTTSPRLDPLSSQTWIFQGKTADQFARARLGHYLAIAERVRNDPQRSNLET